MKSTHEYKQNGISYTLDVILPEASAFLAFLTAFPVVLENLWKEVAGDLIARQWGQQPLNAMRNDKGIIPDGKELPKGWSRKGSAFTIDILQWKGSLEAAMGGWKSGERQRSSEPVPEEYMTIARQIPGLPQNKVEELARQIWRNASKAKKEVAEATKKTENKTKKA